MLGFNDYQTNPTTPSPAAHLSHLEDMVFNGPPAISFVVDVLKEFGNILDGGYVSDALNVSVKWDGSPAIVFGPDPADKRFFVATKSAFAKLPKLAKTHEDVDAMYSDDRVRIILHQALDELRALEPEHVLQGDVLFAKSLPTDARGAVREQVLDGTAFLTFQPNTILYAVAKDSLLGQQMQDARFGIVIHTAFTGTGQYLSTFKRKNVSPLTYALLKKTPSVLMLDANYDDVTGTATFTEEERGDFLLALAEVQEQSRNISSLCYEVINGEPNIRRMLMRFINDWVREKTFHLTTNEFIAFIAREQQQVQAEKKTSRGFDSVVHRYTGYTTDVSRIGDQFDALFRLHQSIARAKRIVIRKLAQASNIRSFLPTPTGYKVSGPEGFVAISHSGQAVKLVDRLEFSRANFAHRDGN